MTGKTLVVAALLLTGLVRVAAAAESTSEHQSKNAQRVLFVLKSVGVNNPDVHSFVQEADRHIDHGYYNLAEERMLGGKVQLRYKLGLPSPRRMELSYTPSEVSHMRVTASTRGVMVTYHLDFK